MAIKKMIKLSKGFYVKLMNGIFKSTSEDKWFITIFKWMIDSKYRSYKRLDKFLREQLENPDKKLIDTANQFKKYKYDRRIIEILKFVYKKVDYITDKENYGKIEYWASAIETLNREKDDCDGINALIYILARLSGMPGYLIYSVIGDTKDGGHFWVVYLSSKKRKLYVIDGTYHVDLQQIEYQRKPFTFSSDKYQKIWYVFNDDHTFKQR